MTCRAVQYSDTTECETCGLRWDTNDPEPPACAEADMSGHGVLMAQAKRIRELEAEIQASKEELEGLRADNELLRSEINALHFDMGGF